MIDTYKNEKGSFARYIHPKDVYDPPPEKLMYAGALIKKPKNAEVQPAPAPAKKKKAIASEGSVSCGSSSDGDNIIIIKAGALRTLTFDKNSDVSDSDEEKEASVPVIVQNSAPDAPKRQIEEIEQKVKKVADNLTNSDTQHIDQYIVNKPCLQTIDAKSVSKKTDEIRQEILTNRRKQIFEIIRRKSSNSSIGRKSDGEVEVQKQTKFLEPADEIKVGKLVREGSFKVPKLKNELDIFNQGSKPRKRKGRLFGLNVDPIAEDIKGEKSTDRQQIMGLSLKNDSDKERMVQMTEQIRKINAKDFGLKS